MRANSLHQLSLSFWLILFIGWSAGTTAVAQSSNVITDIAIDAENPLPHPVGLQLWHLSETTESLSWSQALTQFQQQKSLRSKQAILTLGVGGAPRWLYLSINNRSENILERQLLMGSPWLDYLDVYLLNSQGDLQQVWHTGDMQAFGERKKATPGFLFPLSLVPGNNQVLMRVDTPDPMILPVFLLTPQTLEAKATADYFRYGLGYGYLLAFIILNLMLYFGLRNNSHLLYAIYLIIFMLTNITYAGYGYAWLWPNSPGWQHWIQPILIVSFGVFGLLFSMSFLTIRDYSKRLHHIAISVMVLSIVLLSLCIALEQKTIALLVAFGFMAVYAVIMLSMGITVFVRRKPGIGYYLSAAITGVVGVVLTIVSVWGVIPYDIGFHSAAIGMLLEATLLALALVMQIRQTQEDRYNAEQMANTDLLTGINNRRAFYLMSPAIWSSSLRYAHPLSVILLDIDHFKRVNDTYGHACGDHVLIQVGKFLQQQARQSDLVVRWGGEEFLLLLPETNAQDAQQFAERLREQLIEQEIMFGNVRAQLSASLGVTERRPEDVSIDEMIERADAALYQAKQSGRNCTRTILTHDTAHGLKTG